MQQAVRLTCVWFFRAIIIFILPVFALAPTSLPAAAEKKRATLILDLSTSMAGPISSAGRPRIIQDYPGDETILPSRNRRSSQSRIGVVRKALGRAYRDFSPRIDLGIVAFGHSKPGNCSDIASIKPVGKINPAEYKRATDALLPVGVSPVTDAIKFAAEKADYKNTANTFILLTDSVDSCSANPCQYGAELRNSGANITVHVIAIGLAAEKQKNLRCLAGHTRGHFFSVSSRGQLTKAIYSAFNGVSITSLLKPEPAPSAEIIAETQAAGNGISREARITGEIPLPRRKPKAPSKLRMAEAAPETKPPAKAQPEEKPRKAVRETVAAPSGEKPASPEKKPEAGAVISESQPETSTMLPGMPPALAPNVGQVNVAARVIKGAAPMEGGVSWAVYSSDNGAAERRVAMSNAGRAEFKLPAGNYIIKASLGLARAQAPVVVRGGQKTSRDIVFNAGGLKLSSVVSGGKEGKSTKISYTIRDAKGRVLARNIGANRIIHLNAGSYGITSHYGTTNSIVKAELEVLPGKLTEATLSHNAGRVTFKLTEKRGGAPFSGVEWKITRSDGEIIVTSKTATPAYILASGTYKAIAKHKGKVYRSSFIVRPGEDKTKEVTTE